MTDQSWDERAAALTRSAERLVVGTQVVPVGRAVLRVETVTEEVLVPVTVTRQRVRVDVVDVDPAAGPATDQLLGGTRNGATGAWLTLYDEQPVVTVQAVPTERVRLVTEWVSGSEDVHAELAHDEVVVEQEAFP